MRTKHNNPDRWHFTAETTKAGHSYVYAYQTQWDPITSRTRRTAKVYVGKLLPDRSVAISKAFKAARPQYQEGVFYFTEDKRLVDQNEFLHNTAHSSSLKTDAEEDAHCAIKTVGLSWTAWALGKAEGLLDDLITVFGEEDGQHLFNLAVYRLDGGLACEGFQAWCHRTWLEHSQALSGEQVSDLLQKVKTPQVQQFFELRSELNSDSVAWYLEHYQRWTHGDRPCATAADAVGRAFVAELAVALRTLMQARMAETLAKDPTQGNLPRSLDGLLSALQTIMAERPEGGTVWVLKPISQAKLDYLALMGLSPIPAKLTCD